ncbi:hypothetical protein E2C01_004326 [Portunus trituberculatus]|uniref:Uncharacterized protein n=1 Tax=Portunus trituberculatus TaxID=210409 RepID=A0A5B7CSR0_PORTR|nr:hypothetical protein [Portunus trituberculatus]
MNGLTRPWPRACTALPLLIHRCKATVIMKRTNKLSPTHAFYSTRETESWERVEAGWGVGVGRKGKEEIGGSGDLRPDSLMDMPHTGPRSDHQSRSSFQTGIRPECQVESYPLRSLTSSLTSAEG